MGAFFFSVLYHAKSVFEKFDLKTSVFILQFSLNLYHVKKLKT